MTMTSTSALVSAILGGDIHRYAEIVRRFDERVRQVVHAAVNESATREDLIQETFYRAFLNLDALRQTDRLESWLCTIARNCVRDHFRRSKRRQREASCGLQIECEPDPFASKSSDACWIWQEIEQLAPDFFQALSLRYRRGLSHRQIASELGLPESTVRGRIFEARKALKKRLTNKGLFP